MTNQRVVNTKASGSWHKPMHKCLCGNDGNKRNLRAVWNPCSVQQTTPSRHAVHASNWNLTQSQITYCFYLIGEGGIPVLELWGWLNTKHPTVYRWDLQEFTKHIHSQPRVEGHHAPCRATQGCTQEQIEQSGAVGSRICSIKRVRCLLVFTGRSWGYDWLVWIIPQAGAELKPITQG